MTFQKYKYRKYSEKAPGLFYREKARLKKILPAGAVIFHGGSSAVRGLGGKGIIDIFISVKKSEISRVVKRLKTSGYIHKPDKERKDREYFERYIKYKGERRVHIHLTFHDSFEMRRAVSFVVYLKKHPEVVKEYAKIKREAVKMKKKGEDYRKHKAKFLKGIGKAAMREMK